jgi:hypothetical protein
VKQLTAAVMSMVFLGALCTGRAEAATLDFLGTWTVTASEPAPWADPKDKPVASDLKALIGHAIAFRSDAIDAPAPLKCRKPH